MHSCRLQWSDEWELTKLVVDLVDIKPVIVLKANGNPPVAGGGDRPELG